MNSEYRVYDHCMIVFVCHAMQAFIYFEIILARPSWRSHNCDAAVEMGVLAYGDTSLTVRKPPRENLFELFHGSVCFFGLVRREGKGPSLSLE